MSVVDGRGTMAADPLAVMHRDTVAAQLAYWEARFQACPTDPMTRDIRAALRSAVRMIEAYYGMDPTIQTRSERPR